MVIFFPLTRTPIQSHFGVIHERFYRFHWKFLLCEHLGLRISIISIKSMSQDWHIVVIRKQLIVSKCALLG